MWHILLFVALLSSMSSAYGSRNNVAQVLVAYGSGPAIISSGPGSQTQNISELGFGSIIVYDHTLSDGPDPTTSKYLGQARGLVAIDALNGLNLINLFSCDFKNDMFNGSMNFVGTDDFLQPQRIVQLTGGSGDFLLAKGYMIIETLPPGGLTAPSRITIHYVVADSLLDF